VNGIYLMDPVPPERTSPEETSAEKPVGESAITANRGWANKFRVAFRGIRLGVAGESSFLVHGALTLVVVLFAVTLRVSRTEWCLLVVCFAGVLASEMLNSALESLAKAVDERYNPALGAALDIASGAVLLAAMGAATVGVLVFVPHLWTLLLG